MTGMLTAVCSGNKHQNKTKSTSAISKKREAHEAVRIRKEIKQASHGYLLVIDELDFLSRRKTAKVESIVANETGSLLLRLGLVRLNFYIALYPIKTTRQFHKMISVRTVQQEALKTTTRTATTADLA